jgi:hypothetical protein
MTLPLAMLFALLAASPAAAPYPPSPVIASVTFDGDTLITRAPGSDNWPLTWAADGHQYTTWGDGGGFGGSNGDGRVSLGVARVEGDANNYTGINLWGGKKAPTPAKFGGKSYGIFALGDDLYMWVSPGSGHENNTEARLAWSVDKGHTWQRADWAFTEADRLIVPTFCQFGRGYTGARDDFVYMYATRLQTVKADIQRPGNVDVLRVPRTRLRERAAYEIFAGFDDTGTPQWSHDFENREATLTDPSGLHRVSATWNPGLQRYLLCAEHSQGYKGNLAIFDAPEPWGPWTTVAYTNNWRDYSQSFFWCLPAKWLSTEGTDFTMVFTGTGTWDAWQSIGGRFVLRDDDGQRK